MRWLALAVSLIASVILIIHNVIVMLLSPAVSSPSVPGLPGSGFTLFTGVLLIASAILGLIGGILAFNRRRLGGFFLIAAAAICLFAHHDTRIYGGFYLLSGIFSFFVKRSFSYEEDEEEYDDDYSDEEDDEEENPEEEPASEKEYEDFRNLSYGNRKRERASRIFRDDRKEYAFTPESEPVPEKVRVRSAKVCPACGASVGVEHRFCFICGATLHTARAEEKVPEETRSDAEVVRPGGAEDLPETPAIVPPGRSDESGSILPTASLLDPSERDGEPEEDSIMDENDEYEEEESPPDIATPHRVFVRPEREEYPVPKRPVRINPDNSYQEFSNYTRRRKRRNQSLLRRILGLLVLLLVVGGIAWFLLGLRRLPGPIPPAPVPGTEQAIIPSEDEIPSDVPPMAQPIPTPSTGLPAIQIAPPTRGVVVGSNVNVRSDHATSGAVVMRLSTDARGELLEEWRGVSGTLTGPWYQIRSGGREGWIYGQYFQRLDAREATLPAGYTAALLNSFGAGKTEMTGQVGQPTRRSATALTWAGMVATFKGDNEVTRLQITSAKHVLKNDVAVGVTDEALYKNVGYPSEYKDGQLRYLESPNRGMAIRMKDGKVQSITVGTL